MPLIVTRSPRTRQPPAGKISPSGLAFAATDLFLGVGPQNLARPSAPLSTIVQTASPSSQLGGLALALDGNRNFDFTAAALGNKTTVACLFYQTQLSGKIYPTLQRSNAQVVYLRESPSLINYFRGYSGSGAFWSAAFTPEYGRVRSLVITHIDGSTPRFYIDGQENPSVTVDLAPSGSLVAESGTVSLGELSGAPWGTIDGGIVLHVRCNSVWSSAEAAAFHDNPWQIFTPIERRIWVPSASSAVPSITAVYADSVTASSVDLRVTLDYA